MEKKYFFGQLKMDGIEWLIFEKIFKQEFVTKRWQFAQQTMTAILAYN